MKKLRAPSVPLITVDPYFSVWAPNENLNFEETVHWTGEQMHLSGKLTVDGAEMSFLGFEYSAEKMKQTSLAVDALSTKAVFEGRGVRLFARFMTPLFLDDLKLMTRPVSYLALSYESRDGKPHEVSATVTVTEQFCLNKKKERPVTVSDVKTAHTVGKSLGATEQTPLTRSGDNLRIDWGYMYLTARSDKATAAARTTSKGNTVDVKMPLAEKETALYLFAYDDGVSIDYFGEHLKSLWNADGTTIRDAMDRAAEDYEALAVKADAFDAELFREAKKSGGRKYAELLSLAYRQTIAAHKLVVDKNGEMLFISKECFSNGCAATVDVTYPSMPLFLRYAPDLVRAMIRPIYAYARSDAWHWDFAPHDLGTYPLVTGQIYGFEKETEEEKLKFQMPVEECGNIIIAEAAAALSDGNFEAVRQNADLLTAWAEYLIRYGDDPENQLCTDDFAGHLAHNVNLSVKAIMGIEAMSVIEERLGDTEAAARYRKIAREKAENFVPRAKNADGTLRLAFDREGTFSMKYNAVWDFIWETGVFPPDTFKKETASYLRRMNRYGMPLDNRAEYTKTDWIVWAGTMMKTGCAFRRFVAPLWRFYNETYNRVPMADWIETKAPRRNMFQNRTVQGGLFMKMYADWFKNKQ